VSNSPLPPSGRGDFHLFFFDHIPMLTRLIYALLLLTFSLSVHAGLVIQGSRIIYNEGAGEATVSMQYVGDAPTLLQAWIETEEGAGGQPGEGEVPFILMPAVARLDPGNGQTIRILRIRDGLPQDRESIFYFNTLEVPPAPTTQLAAGEAFMQFSIRGQFKLFYRPKDLAVPSAKAIEMLQFAMAEPSDDGRVQVRVRNASPYHVTFSTLKLRSPGAMEGAEALASFGTDTPGVRMVPPLGEIVMTLDRSAHLPAGVEVEFAIINDAGGLESRVQKVG